VERELPKTVREKLGRRQVPQVFGGLSEDIVLARPLGGAVEQDLAANFDPESHEEIRKGSARLQVEEIRKLVQDLMARRTIPYTAEWRQERDRLTARLEEQGQEVLLRYITGDELAPAKEDFILCEESFDQASTLAPWAADLEVRAAFCKGRARLFDLETSSSSATQNQILRESLQLFQKALDLDPVAGYIYNAIGVAYLENGMFEEAARYFNDAILLNPHWAYAYHNLALTGIEQGRYGDAEKQYRRGVEAAGHYGIDYGYLRHGLGLLYQRLGRYYEAEAEYTRAAKLFGRGKENFAALSSRLPDGPRAERAQSRAADLRGHEAKTWNAIGTVLDASGRRKHADSYYRQALALDPALAPARHNLGLWLESRGEAGNAIGEWRENERRNPEFTPSIRSLALAYETEARSSQGANAENANRLALGYYRQLTQLDPAYVEGRLGLVRVLLALGLPDQGAALTAAEEAVALRPQDPETLKVLGDVLRQTGRTEEAVRRYNEALKYAMDGRLKREIRDALRQTEP
jgi:Flp pilus assembly protein TadD